MKYGIGCIKSRLDGSEHKFSMERKIQLPPEYSYISVMPPVLDQGQTSECVCYSLTSVLDFKINRFRRKNTSNNLNINLLYNQRKDKSQNGMEIKVALSYLRHTGLDGNMINSYAMISDPESVKYSLLVYGPCVAALPVYAESEEGMFWRKNGAFAGGHCITLIGYDRDGFIIRNSWGENWGNRGHIVFPYSDFNTFFEIWSVV